jgi:hypothetical protein
VPSMHLGWALLVACNANRDGSSSGAGRLSLDRDAIVFDTVDIGTDEPGHELLSFENVGGGELSVSTPHVSTGSSFSVSGEDVTLAPGDRGSYDIAFDPRTPFGHDEVLVLATDDQDGLLSDISLHGEATAPVVQVDAVDIDFGVVDVGCERYEDVLVTNGGNEPLEVDPLFDTTSSELALESDGSALEIAPGESAMLQVAYLPSDDTADSATLTVESNDPITPEVAVDLSGAGQAPAEQLDVFEHVTAEADIVFIVDNSGSMDTEQPELAGSIDAFLAQLDAGLVDYRIGVITTDQSGFRGPVVTPLTADPIAMLAAQVTGGLGGSGTTRALQMLYNCALPGGDCSAAAGFMRDDALLLPIVVSDGVDQSALAPDDYVEYLWTLKSDVGLVRVDVVAGAVPGPPSCATCSSPGYGYDQAQELTDGSFYDVCAADWDTVFTAIAQHADTFGRSLPLSQDPLEDTIEVSVDGVVTVAGWTYTGRESEGGTNAVAFQEESRPALGATIEVRYTVAVACE